MAKLVPSFENINRLKIKPTDGEIFLLNFLVEQLQDDYEVYFQPFLNGDMPDIVVMRKGVGVVIIEVKDWKLNSYNIDEQNNWRETANDHVIKSPFQQVFGYKSNMFNLHINGLAEKNVMNKNFYAILKTFVYFHGSSKSEIENIYYNVENTLKGHKDKLYLDRKNERISHNFYEKQREYYVIKTKQIRRDKAMALNDGKSLSKYSKVLRLKTFYLLMVYTKNLSDI